jgi:FkbM family methyltransferase
MGEMPFLSYAQRYEDVYLSRCFAGLREGFYIDIGAGHPVHDSASFAFYLQGWRGITVEPNPRLVRLTHAVRPRDCCIEAVIGGASGEATFYLVDELHGFSTTIEAHAQSAQEQFGKPSRSHRVPMLSLSELCRQNAPRTFEFLKIDVEGAEKEVLFSGDWENFRPKVIVIEALAPYTLAPAWHEWEPFLNQHGYAYACFDTLNRYYVAQEAQELAKRFDDIESATACTHQLRSMEPAHMDAAHPDHALATLLARAFMTELPLLDLDLMCRLLTIDTPAEQLDRPAEPETIDEAVARVLGSGASFGARNLLVSGAPTLREVYAAIVASDDFRAAAGRISASNAW